MLQNYLTTFVRILFRQKIYSFLNVAGLSIGIAAALLIGLYISDELSYDTFHRDAHRIYRVTMDGFAPGGGEFNTVKVPYPFAETLQKEIPSVESTLRVKLLGLGGLPIRFDERAFTTTHFLYVDSNFFEFFDFKLNLGNKKEVLKGPNKVVLTEAMAKKLFDIKENDYNGVIGKTIQVGEPVMTAVVTGIAQNPPANSHFHFEVLCSSESWDQFKIYDNWVNINGAYTYFKLRNEAQINSVNSIYPVFIEKYVSADWERLFKTDWKSFLQKGGKVFFRSQKLTDIHLLSNFRNEFEPNGNIQYVYLFSAIGLLIIVLACVNFTNLATARASTRAKEIGIRKTIGALRKRLMVQFLLESFLYTLISVGVALAIVSAFLTPFNFIAGKELSITNLYQPQIVVSILILILTVSLLAGGHPAFLLTSFNPASVLKGSLHSVIKGAGIRKGLVVFQFCISLCLIISTLVVYQQLKFIQGKALGFNKENILRINNAYSLHKNSESFKEELLRNSGIVNASYSGRMFPDIKEAYGILAIGAEPEEHLASMYNADYDHLQTMELQMAKGRFFLREFPSDSTAIVINEKAAQEIGYKSFEGRKITSPAFDLLDTFHIIGIIKDFHFQGLQNPIKPLVITLCRVNDKDKMAIRLAKGDAKEKVAFIESLWKKFVPETPINFSFLDDDFDAQYRAEERLEQVFYMFTVLAIAIACLGLFGLAAFTADQRTKEIGIRKVMGASVQQVIVLLSKEFVRLIFVAFVIAVPISWYAMNQWLQTFAYRINFEMAVAIWAGALILVISLLTVSYQSIKAAIGNPVTSLRSE